MTKAEGQIKALRDALTAIRELISQGPNPDVMTTIASIDLIIAKALANQEPTP